MNWHLKINIYLKIYIYAKKFLNAYHYSKNENVYLPYHEDRFNAFSLTGVHHRVSRPLMSRRLKIFYIMRFLFKLAALCVDIYRSFAYTCHAHRTFPEIRIRVAYRVCKKLISINQE